MPAAAPPSPLPRFAASFNAVTLQPEAGPHRGPVTRLCLFGGSTQANDFLDDTTFLDPLEKVWEPVIAVGEQETVVRPMMRWGHAAVTYRNHVVLFGTCHKKGRERYMENLRCTEGARSDVTWPMYPPYAGVLELWAGRGQSTHLHGGVSTGGSKPGEAFNDLWILEPQSRVWTEIKVRQLDAHTLAHPDILCTGIHHNPFQSRCGNLPFRGLSVFSLHCASPRVVWWLQSKTPEAPCPCKRGGHSATVVQQRFLYVFGGNTLQDSFNDTWRIDLHECLAHGVADWERVDTTGEVKHTPLSLSSCRFTESIAECIASFA